MLPGLRGVPRHQGYGGADLSAPPPPDTMAQLDHCLRTHPETTATVAERSDLCFHAYPVDNHH